MAGMFGALNRFIARLDNDPSAQKPSSAGAYGFHVLRNTDPNLHLEPWFDFIIGVNGRTIDSADPNLFATEVRNCAGSTISLGVYGAKGQQIREIYAAVPPESPALGLTLQWSPLNTVEDVWHILDVMPNSPADVAGVLPYSDYVIGSPEGLLRGEAGLSALVEEFMNRALGLFVYNSEYDVTRTISITPAKSWGGEGALGCLLGYGALHRVPAPLTEPPQAPGETLFETARFSNEEQRPSSAAPPLVQAPTDPADFLVPANMQFPSTSPPPPSSAGPPVGKARKTRAYHTTAPAAGLDDYFKEGEQKSRELDGCTPKPSGVLSPPPKGGPPKAASPAPAGE